MIFTSLGSSLNSLTSKPVSDQRTLRNSNASTSESGIGVSGDPSESAVAASIPGASTESMGLTGDDSSVG